MDANIVIAPGFPHELLGLLRRMPGIGDLELLQDSDEFSQTFATRYPDKSEYIKIINRACELGVIAEMSSIIDEPMWRKRSFLNKSIIQLMTGNMMKEYQACELLESFMQIFGWEFEVKVARRWETTEEDSTDYRKSQNQGSYVKSQNTSTNDRNAPDESDAETENDETEEADEKNDEQQEKQQVKQQKQINHNAPVSTGVEHTKERHGTAEGNKSGSTVVKGRNSQQRNNRTYVKQADEQKKQSAKKDNSHLSEISVYADEDNIYDRDAYIKNEILKGGIKFENLMSNAIKRDVRSAIKGNSEAQYRMGKYYAESNTKHTDYEEALKWYKVSASQGNKKAQFELGMLYDGGKVKCKDYKSQAMKCYLGLAESGFPTAQCMVGMKYKFGDGVEEDINEAIKWFKRAAAQGHTDAQRNLGDTYMAIGKKNEAMKWYERAAAAGDSYCEKMLGNR